MNRSRRGTTAPRASRTGPHRVAAGTLTRAEPPADSTAYAVATALAVTAFAVTVGLLTAATPALGATATKGGRSGPVAASSASASSATTAGVAGPGRGIAKFCVARRDDRSRRRHRHPDPYTDTIGPDRHPVARPDRPNPVGVGPALAVTVRRAHQHSTSPDASCRRPGAGPTDPARPGSGTTRAPTRAARGRTGGRGAAARPGTRGREPAAARGAGAGARRRRARVGSDPTAEPARHSDGRAVALRRWADHVRGRGQRVDHRERAPTPVVAFPRPARSP